MLDYDNYYQGKLNKKHTWTIKLVSTLSEFKVDILFYKKTKKHSSQYYIKVNAVGLSGSTGALDTAKILAAVDPFCIPLDAYMKAKYIKRPSKSAAIETVYQILEFLLNLDPNSVDEYVIR